MEKDREKVVNILKQQLKLFLLEAEEFYPFGTYMNMKNEIVPVSAYFDDEEPSSLKIIGLLEKTFNDYVKKGICKIGIIAIDVVVRNNIEHYNAVEMRFFETGKEQYKKYLKYKINEHSVEFLD